jgi:hypothetical protein
MNPCLKVFSKKYHIGISIFKGGQMLQLVLFVIAITFSPHSFATVSSDCLFGIVEQRYPQYFPANRHAGTSTVNYSGEQEYSRNYSNNYRSWLATFQNYLWYGFQIDNSGYKYLSVEQANQQIAGGNCSIQRCYGAVGNQCDGVGTPFVTAHPLQAQVEWVTPGSIKHDSCCYQHPEGYACRGYGTKTVDENRFCRQEWDSAVRDTREGYTWKHTFGPYVRDQGDTPSSINNLKAPDGTRLSISDEKYCRAGSFLEKNQRVGMCGKAEQCNGLVEAGGITPETHSINLGKNGGTFVFEYETFKAADRITMLYGGSIIFDSGCVGTNGKKYKTITYPTYTSAYNSGRVYSITVYVSPNCAATSSTTEWNFKVNCPK